jgi:hypothetical protein
MFVCFPHLWQLIVETFDFYSWSNEFIWQMHGAPVIMQHYQRRLCQPIVLWLAPKHNRKQLSCCSDFSICLVYNYQRTTWYSTWRLFKEILYIFGILVTYCFPKGVGHLSCWSIITALGNTRKPRCVHQYLFALRKPCMASHIIEPFSGADQIQNIFGFPKFFHFIFGGQ